MYVRVHHGYGSTVQAACVLRATVPHTSSRTWTTGRKSSSVQEHRTGQPRILQVYALQNGNRAHTVHDFILKNTQVGPLQGKKNVDHILKYFPIKRTPEGERDGERVREKEGDRRT
ncbi:hypothetical protein J6590_012263 [Homalodisca vitripennis]|nr:hypothetical protein J6590_012263 [Homalodisca vitripennis]